MKKIILLFLATGSFIACSSDNDKNCYCEQQRWERKATYTVGSSSTPQTFVSATEWQTAGNKERLNSDDCSQNGTKVNSGNTGSTLSSDGTKYTTTEYEYKISCQ